ncbi:MAG: hypothetical protein AAF564_04875 [Bacteroidota bacterium]
MITVATIAIMVGATTVDIIDMISASCLAKMLANSATGTLFQ